MTGVGVQQTCDQIKEAYIGSLLPSAKLVELLTGKSQPADHVFTKMILELNVFSISLSSQSKIQEVLDKVALNNLFENHTSEREK